MTRTVTAREANQQFSKILARAERGERIVILKRGRPVAMISPPPAEDPAVLARERADAVAELADIWTLHGKATGLGRPTRDEMHER